MKPLLTCDWNNACYGGAWNYALNHVYREHYMIDNAPNGGLSDGSYSHKQNNTVCSDDGRLQRVYDKQDMLMDSSCCIQHGNHSRSHRR